MPLEIKKRNRTRKAEFIFTVGVPGEIGERILAKAAEKSLTRTDVIRDVLIEKFGQPERATASA